MVKRIDCDLCGESYVCKKNNFLSLELFRDEVYREGHQESIDCWDICLKCIKKLKERPFAKQDKGVKNE